MIENNEVEEKKNQNLNIDKENEIINENNQKMIIDNENNEIINEKNHNLNINIKNNEIINEQKQNLNKDNEKKQKIEVLNVPKENKKISEDELENKNIILEENGHFNTKSEILDKILCNNKQLNNNKLTEQEILKAKENSFILIGKTGVGKTSLLNIIYGQNIGEVGHSTFSQTKSSNCYCIKEKIEDFYLYFSIIDTPGLYDTQGKDADNNQKKNIMELISKEGVKIKGLLFLTNFQNERFDSSEQLTLIDYNCCFPLKDFWKRIIFIFTHYYGDPDGYSKEEMKENNSKLKSIIFEDIMEKVKNVSNPIQFKDLNCKYINIRSRHLNDLKNKDNQKIREEIMNEIIKYINEQPMFNKLQIFNFKNFEIEKNDKFLYDCEFYVYLDANNKVIHQDFHIIKQTKKNIDNIKEQKIELDIEDCQLNEEGNLIKKTTKKEGIIEKLKNNKGKIGDSLTVISAIGILFGLSCLPFLPVPILSFCGGIYLSYEDRIEKKKDKKLIEEIIKKENINELIQNEYHKFKMNKKD